MPLWHKFSHKIGATMNIKTYLSTRPLLGTLGHLGIFIWLLASVMVVPAEKIAWAVPFCGVVITLFYPRAWRKILNPRWLIFLALMALPTLFFLDIRDKFFLGIPYSSQGLIASGQIAVRFFVILLAVQGFTQRVSIAELAGLLERMGLHGLGFSVGVAVNLLPSLERAIRQTWQSLYMRGGLRKNRWRAIQLLMLTVVTNTLKQAEDIALAAEGRAFSPENTRPLPIQRGLLDWMPAALGFGLLLILYMV